jgi:hypothetical protein
VHAGAAGHSLGEATARCWTGQGSHDGVHAGGAGSGAAAASTRAMGRGAIVRKLPAGASARSRGGGIWGRGFQQVGMSKERGG